MSNQPRNQSISRSMSCSTIRPPSRQASDTSRPKDALDETRDFWILSDPMLSPHVLRLHPRLDSEVDPGKAVHQGVYLPDVGSFKLPQMVIPLRGPSDLEDWSMAVREVLSRYRLQNLIDWKVPRPKWSDPTALKWQTLSRLVQVWLFDNIAPSFLKLIMKRKPRMELADEFMEDTHKAVYECGIRWDNDALLECLRLRRADCPNAKLFIEGLDIMYSMLWVYVPPRVIIAILLKELSEEMPSRTAMVLADIGTRNPSDNLTKADFEKIRDFLAHCL